MLCMYMCAVRHNALTASMQRGCRLDDETENEPHLWPFIDLGNQSFVYGVGMLSILPHIPGLAWVCKCLLPAVERAFSIRTAGMGS